MENILNLIGSFGGLVVLAGLFVWSYLQDRKENKKRQEDDEKRETQNQEMLKSVAQSNENIAKSIDAINNTTDVLKECIINHDERAKRIDHNVEYIKERIDKQC